MYTIYLAMNTYFFQIFLSKITNLFSFKEVTDKYELKAVGRRVNWPKAARRKEKELV